MAEEAAAAAVAGLELQTRVQQLSASVAAMHLDFGGVMDRVGDLGALRGVVVQMQDNLAALTASASEYQEWTRHALQTANLEFLRPALDQVREVVATKPNWATDIARRSSRLRHRLQAIQDADDLGLSDKLQAGIQEAAAFAKGTVQDMKKLAAVRQILVTRLEDTHHKCLRVVTSEIHSTFTQLADVWLRGTSDAPLPSVFNLGPTGQIKVDKEVLAGFIGPFLLRFVYVLNLPGLFLSPLLFLAILTALMLDFRRTCEAFPIKIYFITKLVIMALMWMSRLEVFVRYRAWADQSQKLRMEAGVIGVDMSAPGSPLDIEDDDDDRSDAGSVQDPGEADTKPATWFEWYVQHRQEFEVEATTGLLGVATLDRIQGSTLHWLHKVLTPFTIGLDLLGVYYALRYRCARCNARWTHVMLWILLFWTAVSIVARLCDLAKLLIELATLLPPVRRRIRATITQLDTEYAGGLPIARTILRTLFHRNPTKTLIAIDRRMKPLNRLIQTRKIELLTSRERRVEKKVRKLEDMLHDLKMEKEALLAARRKAYDDDEEEDWAATAEALHKHTPGGGSSDAGPRRRRSSAQSGDGGVGGGGSAATRPHRPGTGGEEPDIAEAPPGAGVAPPRPGRPARPPPPSAQALLRHHQQQQQQPGCGRVPHQRPDQVAEVDGPGHWEFSL